MTIDGAPAGDFTLGVSLSRFATDITLGGESARLRQTQVAVPMSFRLSDAWTLSATLVFVADGRLSFDDGPPAGPAPTPPRALRYDLQPGAAAGLGLSWRALEAPRDGIDLSLAFQLAAASTRLRTPDSVSMDVPRGAEWMAFDLRVSLTASRTFGGVLTPWASVRVFGGPIAVGWDGRDGTSLGSDDRHVQLAAGVSVRPFPLRVPGLRLFVEGAALSERGFTLGASHAF